MAPVKLADMSTADTEGNAERAVHVGCPQAGNQHSRPLSFVSPQSLHRAACARAPVACRNPVRLQSCYELNITIPCRHTLQHTVSIVHMEWVNCPCRTSTPHGRQVANPCCSHMGHPRSSDARTGLAGRFRRLLGVDAERQAGHECTRLLVAHLLQHLGDGDHLGRHAVEADAIDDGVGVYHGGGGRAVACCCAGGRRRRLLRGGRRIGLQHVCPGPRRHGGCGCARRTCEQGAAAHLCEAVILC